MLWKKISSDPSLQVPLGACSIRVENCITRYVGFGLLSLQLDSNRPKPELTIRYTATLRATSTARIEVSTCTRNQEFILCISMMYHKLIACSMDGIVKYSGCLWLARLQQAQLLRLYWERHVPHWLNTTIITLILSCDKNCCALRMSSCAANCTSP